MRAAAIILTLALIPIAAQAGTDCGTSAACDSQEHHDASDAKRSVLVDATGTPYTAGAGVPVVGPVDQAAAGSAAQAWYTRPAPGGANMSPTNPLIVELSDGTTVYAGPTSAQFPAALVGGRLSVDGSGVTQPISAAALPLPTGAATSARQAAPGTAGTASADVITVQGIASMTPIAISGTVTAAEAGATAVGTSSTIACDTTAAVVDDTSVANTTARKVELCNPSTNSASIYATGSGGTGGREVLPGACYELLLAASSTPLYCYAASAVSATATETK